MIEMLAFISLNSCTILHFIANALGLLVDGDEDLGMGCSILEGVFYVRLRGFFFARVDWITFELARIRVGHLLHR